MIEHKSTEVGSLPRRTELFNEVINSLNPLYDPDDHPQKLYHYTDFAGLHGILHSHNLRPTYNRALNDASEQIYAEKALAALAKHTPRIAVGSRKNFLACFCDSDRLLSMWRSYGANGGGYCLGFSYSELRRIWWPDPAVGASMPLLARVFYGSAVEPFVR